MSKGFITFSLFALFYLFSTFVQTTKAVEILDNNFDVYISNPKTPDVPEAKKSFTITIELKNGADFFDTSGKTEYFATLTNPPCRYEKSSKIVADQAQGLPKVISGKQVQFTFNPNQGAGNTCANPGSYSFGLFVGHPVNNNYVVKDFTFQVIQKDGGNLTIEPSKSLFEANEQIRVNISNVRQGAQYVLWWDGSITSKASDFTASTNENIIGRPVSRDGGDFNTSKDLKLCIADVSNNPLSTNPATQDCKISTVISYRAVASSLPKQPTTVSCKLFPERPYKGTSLSVIVNDGELGSQVWADFKLSTDHTQTTSSTIVKEGIPAEIKLTAKLDSGSYSVKVFSSKDGNRTEICQNRFNNITVGTSPLDPTQTQSGQNTPKGSPVPATGQPCYSDKDKKNPIDGTISTAIGCIRTDPVGLVQDFFKLAVGIGGGIALLLMIAGAFEMVSSAGNPESVKSGKERFVSAIEGLLFIIFSILLLRIIGVDILGFGEFLGATQ